MYHHARAQEYAVLTHTAPLPEARLRQTQDTLIPPDTPLAPSNAPERRKTG